MYPYDEQSPPGTPISDDTVSSLRHRLNVMKEIFGEDTEDLVQAEDVRRKKAKRRNKDCMATIIDGSFMGMVMGVCLMMVLGAAFFAYKNLYHAVMKKMYPETSA